MELIAFDSRNTRGIIPVCLENWLVEEESVLDPFDSDRYKIMQSKSLRRSFAKTQVFFAPYNRHVRNRGTHSLEVAAIAAVIANYLGVNVKLCEAIGMGHDLGHLPYGHLAEEVTSELSGKIIRHERLGPVILCHVERKGNGLPIHYETIEGIIAHSRGSGEMDAAHNQPQEYTLVMYVDKIAYTFSDINDAIRYGYLKEKDLPSCVSSLDNKTATQTQRSRTDICARALIQESLEKGYVSFKESKVAQNFAEIRNFMYQRVYNSFDKSLQRSILTQAYHWFEHNVPEIDPVLSIALSTDEEMNAFGQLLLSTTKILPASINHFGVFEILPHIKDKNIDITKPVIPQKEYKEK